MTAWVTNEELDELEEDARTVAAISGPNGPWLSCMVSYDKLLAMIEEIRDYRTARYIVKEERNHGV